MANVLLLNHQVPWPFEDGNALRVHQLGRHGGQEHRVHLACFPVRAESRDPLVEQGVYESITLLPAFPARRDWRRHLRRNDLDYHRITYPEHFRNSIQILQDLVDHHGIDVVVATLASCAEFARHLSGTRRIVDQYDSATLALERELEFGVPGRRQRWRLRHKLRSVRTVEASLGEHADIITAISPADVARLRDLNAANGCPVLLLPNGVDAALLERPYPGRPLRAVAFWGNLSFPVNQQAVLWFYHHVWRPFLRDARVDWTIIGPHAPPQLLALADEHAEISVPGFVPDLFAHLEPYGIMVNPMVTGAGLKNKALEALAAGKVVISTWMGAEALAVEDGKHAVLADSPRDFARAVIELLEDPPRRDRLVANARRLVSERYTWEAVGSSWSGLVSKYGGSQRG